jgi:CheY-like chemotaxis protein
MFAAVITDERMPGMSGTALIREVRSIRRELPVVLVSGYLEEAEVAQAQEYGADQILRKPLLAIDLSTCLARVLALR